MNNHPFVVTSTNVIDESFFTATPTYVNGQNVFVSQEKQRKLFDNLNTSIIGISPSAGGPQFYPGNFIQAERYYGPGGMIFTFPSGPSNPPGVPVQGSLQFNRFNPYPLPPNGLRNDVLHSPGPPFQGSAPMNYRTLPLPGLRSPQYQEQLAQNPFYFQPQQLPGYKLRFHSNEGTSCSDLLNSDNQVPSSQGAPDFKNLAGLMYQLDSANNYPTDPTNAPICYPNIANDLASNVKRLVINKPVESPQQHVADILDEQKQDQVEEQKDKKGVTFSNQPDKAEKGDQTSFPYCNCNNAGSRNGPNTENDNTNSRRNPVKNFFRRKSAKYDSDKYSSDNSEKEQPKRNRTNKGKNKKSKGKKEEPEYDSETSDSEYVCRCTI